MRSGLNLIYGIGLDYDYSIKNKIKYEYLYSDTLIFIKRLDLTFIINSLFQHVH